MAVKQTVRRASAAERSKRALSLELGSPARTSVAPKQKTEQALRDNEARLRAVLETAVDGIITINERGIIESYNQAAEKLFGYSAREAIGQNVSFLMPSPHREQHDRYLAHYRDTGERKIIGIGREVAGRRKDGSTFPVGLAVSEVQLGGRRIFTGIVRDLTERRRLESELLEISDRERQRIGQDLHDGLGQQLTALELMCHSFREDLGAGQPLLEKQAAKMCGFLREAISQTRTLSHGLAPVKLEAAGLMAALAQLARATNSVSKIKCQLHCARPVLIADSTVSGHLYRIAQEAVNNALKHGRPDAIEIALNQRDQMIRLRISDDGKGLPKTRKPGAGMGLEVMKHRASILGATLAIESKPGRGVTVECALPLQKS